jgi:hypothetical protein
MSIKSRLKKLERANREKDMRGNGPCRGCGWAPGDIRTIEVVEPGSENNNVPDQPNRPRCRICGDFMPPIAIIGFSDDDDDSDPPASEELT